MTKTTQDILELNPTLSNLINDSTIAGSAKIKVADLVEAFNKRAQVFEKERQALNGKYTEDQQDEFTKEIEDMLAVTLEIPDTTFTKEELRLDTSKVTALDLINLKKHGLMS